MKIFSKTFKPSQRGVAYRQTGDTIIEVLISMSILVLVLTATYVSSSRSLQNGTDSSNRQQALALAGQQVEFIKTSPSTYQTTGNFCAYVDSTTNTLKSAAPTSAQCQQANGQYTMTDTYNANGLYTIVASWPLPGSSTASQLTLYYRAP